MIEEQGGGNRSRRGKRGKEETMWESWVRRRREQEEEVGNREETIRNIERDIEEKIITRVLPQAKEEPEGGRFYL